MKAVDDGIIRAVTRFKKSGNVWVNRRVSKAFSIPRETLFEYALQISDAIDALQTEARE